MDISFYCQEHGFWITSFDQFANYFSLNFSISNFIAFKLTFIQFNSHTPLPFQSYVQTSRRQTDYDDWRYVTYSTKRMEATIEYLCIGTRRTPRGDCRGWPPTCWTQGLSS